MPDIHLDDDVDDDDLDEDEDEEDLEDDVETWQVAQNAPKAQPPLDFRPATCLDWPEFPSSARVGTPRPARIPLAWHLFSRRPDRPCP